MTTHHHTSPSAIETIRGELARTSLSATTINFVVWIDDPQYRSWVLERAGRLAEKHPSRTVILDCCPDTEGAILVHGDRDDASHVTAQSDRVIIGASGMTPDELRETTHALLIPDLPTVLWWTPDAITGEEAFEALLDIADALVVDSSGSTTSEATVTELATFFARRPTLALRDLAWMRLRPWQDMIAQIFDDAALREELFAIRDLRIISGSTAEALYLGGWLASRLGWSPCGRDEFCDRNGIHIPFTRERDGGIRRVRSIEISTPSAVYTASVNPNDENVVTLRSSRLTEGSERHVPLQAIDNASLLERAILEPATDEVFETALRMVGTLLA